MTDKISEARQALRDYAREAYEVQVPMRTSTLRTAEPKTIEVSRGEVGGKAFMAAQTALTVAEELRAEADQPISTFDRYASLEERTIKQAQREAADRIEAAVLKAITS